MACYHPLYGYVNGETEKGKKQLVFSKPRDYEGEEIPLPCGKCVGCCLDAARNFSIRCMHEAQLHEKNCFITLTYADEFLPENGSLDKLAFPLFFKRLRKKYGSGPRYFACGEYGDAGRPHYHAVVFNHDFDDKVLFSDKNGVKQYTSEDLSSLWSQGHSLIADVTQASASYVAGYVLKKVTSKEKVLKDDKGRKFYERFNPLNGEIVRVASEFRLMSKGLGKEWLSRFGCDVFPHDHCVVDGVKFRPPKYYDYLLDKRNPDLLNRLKERRKLVALESGVADSFRRAQMERAVLSRLKLKSRGLEAVT